MLDAAKGLEYLHANGVLHRDIKPDNVLVFALDEVIGVNGKLTDFGSSRNINALMTNMTFTKGIGSPNYMAPEILNQEKYKKPADIFSFAITMLETLKWAPAYPRADFKFPWLVSAFVQRGCRLERPPRVDPGAFAVIERCWAQVPAERIGLSLATDAQAPPDSSSCSPCSPLFVQLTDLKVEQRGSPRIGRTKGAPKAAPTRRRAAHQTPVSACRAAPRRARADKSAAALPAAWTQTSGQS